MLVIAALVIGALIGGLRAKARGGNRLDMAQYAAVHAIALGLVALFVSVYLSR